MKNWEKPPLVMAGLVLGLLALGNLLEGYGTYVRYCLGLVALVFGFLIKGILKNKKESRKELSNPLIASVFTTFFYGRYDFINLYLII